MTWIWPFPRLRFRLRNGYWCTHEKPVEPVETVVLPRDEFVISKKMEPAWYPGNLERPDGWVMIDLGRRQMRRCSLCQHVEFR